jgi:hypothetical protein
LIFAAKQTGRILAIAQSQGKKHDYALFKEESRWLKSQSKLLLDTGFIGVKERFTNAVHPHKASKLHPLTREQKAKNREISSARIAIEHINARLKRFKIMASPYRGGRRKFLLRSTLIAALINLNLG